MLRVILDKHGSGSNDLFVKIDGSPARAWIVDTSWLGFFFNSDFFNSSDEDVLWTDENLIVDKKADVDLLIQFWQKMLLSDQTICYLPYDLSDQYIGALQITKRKKLYHITRVYTLELTGNMTDTYFLQVQHTVEWRQSTNPVLEWELAPSSILTGLTWSLTQLEQPVVPLRYD